MEEFGEMLRTKMKSISVNSIKIPGTPFLTASQCPQQFIENISKQEHGNLEFSSKVLWIFGLFVSFAKTDKFVLDKGITE